MRNISEFAELDETPHYRLKPHNIVCSDPEYYGQLYGLVGTVCQSSIFLVGVLGNLMVVVTVRGTKSLHTTTNCYLVSLALADLITLLSSVPQVRSGGNHFILSENESKRPAGVNFVFLAE